MEYKKTLNMPKSGFPMRAGLPKREPEMLRYWQELDLYNELLKKNEGKPLFSLHDGPPFSNGALHMGHALNKALKDFINRSYAMRGYYTPYIPGWDNHGMPQPSHFNRNRLTFFTCHQYPHTYYYLFTLVSRQPTRIVYTSFKVKMFLIKPFCKFAYNFFSVFALCKINKFRNSKHVLFNVYTVFFYKRISAHLTRSGKNMMPFIKFYCRVLNTDFEFR